MIRIEREYRVELRLGLRKQSLASKRRSEGIVPSLLLGIRINRSECRFVTQVDVRATLLGQRI